MSRTRFVWRLSSALCALVVVVLVGCFWVASVELARLADAALLRRLSDAMGAVTKLLPTDGGPIDPAVFTAAATSVQRTAQVELSLLEPDGAVIATTLPPAGPDDSPGEAAALILRSDSFLATARAGRTAITSSYDVARGRRVLAMAMPIGPTGQPTAMLRASTDTGRSDRELAGSQRSILLGFLLCAAVAAAAAATLATRLARPVRELAQAAADVAGGKSEGTLPTPDVAELATLASAIHILREQLVERGLTIGRQDTEQEAVLDSMIEGVLAIDARQRVLGINRAAADLFELDMEADLGRSMQDVIRNPDLRRFALRAIDCREPVEDDIVLPGPRDRTIRVRGTALRDVSGDGGAVIVLNDVTDLKRLENVRRDFVANVSHELKTPVASIKGFVETLLDGAADDPEDRQRFLDIIARQADRLEAIIEDLLALSRIEQTEGAGTLPVETASIAALLSEAANDCLPRATERLIRLEVECDADLEAAVNAPLVEQAMINLIDNAIKACEADDTIRVSARLAADDAGEAALEITVQDEGCGIEPAHLPRLFERFYRVDKGRSRTLGGTGLGLSIVKHIVQAHGGTVGVGSTPGVGTTFTLRMPV
jgi:two-component system, OmpR family, phosphate regulon sensor histidine kinase PhoR